MTQTDTSAKPKLDVNLIKPFVEAVRTVLKTVANVDTTVQRPYMKTADARQYNVFGIIAFSGALTGTVTISFTHASARTVVEAFSGSILEEDSRHFADAIGELANMIAGCAKSKLNVEAKIGMPSIVIGENCHVAAMSDTPCLVIPCTSAAGEFAVEVCIKQKNT